MYLFGFVIVCALIWQASGRPEFPGEKEMLAQLEKFAQGKSPLDEFFESEDYTDMTALFNGMDSTYFEDLFEAESARRRRGFGDYLTPPQIVDYSQLVGNPMTLISTAPSGMDAVPGVNYFSNPNNPVTNAMNDQQHT